MKIMENIAVIFVRIFGITSKFVIVNKIKKSNN